MIFFFFFSVCLLVSFSFSFIFRTEVTKERSYIRAAVPNNSKQEKYVSKRVLSLVALCRIGSDDTICLQKEQKIIWEQKRDCWCYI